MKILKYMIMMKWRTLQMNEKEIVTDMISFIEKKERELQFNKMSSDTQARNDVVKSILDELERVTTDENK